MIDQIKMKNVRNEETNIMLNKSPDSPTPRFSKNHSAREANTS